MNARNLFRASACTCAVGALCCFTPVAVLALTGLGLGAAVSYLDRVLWPLMLASALVMVLAGLRMRKAPRTREAQPQGDAP